MKTQPATKRQSYLKRYYQKYRRKFSEYHRQYRKKPGKCFCGNWGIKRKNGYSVCARCDAIETAQELYELKKLRCGHRSSGLEEYRVFWPSAEVAFV